jgi:hypothetical protein
MQYSVGDIPTDCSIFQFVQNTGTPIYDIEAYRGFLTGAGAIESSRNVQPSTETIKYMGVLVDKDSHVTEEATKLFARTKDYAKPITPQSYIPLVK